MRPFWYNTFIQQTDRKCLLCWQIRGRSSNPNRHVQGSSSIHSSFQIICLYIHASVTVVTWPDYLESIPFMDVRQWASDKTGTNIVFLKIIHETTSGAKWIYRLKRTVKPLPWFNENRHVVSLALARCSQRVVTWSFIQRMQPANSCF